ncbi:MAG: YigZ family protein [Flavobacteriales bacterium]
MEEIFKYQTLKSTSESLFKEKGSKFFGYAFSVFNEEEVKEKLDEIRKLHNTARHHCYGYRLGVGQEERYRANDDGEPSNSAGKPIYGQLLSAEITNVLIVVVRYFGGTKLGVGGLISAYKIAAKEAIDSGIIVTKEIMNYFQIQFDYLEMSGVMNYVKHQKLEVVSQVFEANCEIQFKTSLKKTPSISAFFAEMEGVELSFLGKK